MSKREGGRERERERERERKRDAVYVHGVCAELLGQQHNRDFSGSLNMHTSQVKMISQRCPNYTEKFTIYCTFTPS